MVVLPPIPPLTADSRIRFPEPQPGEEIIALGGNLSPGVLLSAYEQGIFPWYSDGDPLLWWSPLERMVLTAGNLHVSRRMARERRRSGMRITWDSCFHQVIDVCSRIKRGEQDGTWIGDDMVEAYTRLHCEGYAHSVEAWSGDSLAGGLYGVSLGRAFFGESMFSLVPNSSKFCLYALHDRLLEQGFHFIDCQMYTAYLESLGARIVERDPFLNMLAEALAYPDVTGSWASYS